MLSGYVMDPCFDLPERNLPQQTRSKAFLQPACQNNRTRLKLGARNVCCTPAGRTETFFLHCLCSASENPQSLPVLLLFFSIYFFSYLDSRFNVFQKG